MNIHLQTIRVMEAHSQQFSDVASGIMIFVVFLFRFFWPFDKIFVSHTWKHFSILISSVLFQNNVYL